jgi:hypothetical protein
LWIFDPKVFSTWPIVPLRATYIPLGRVLVTLKPWSRSQFCTAVTEDGAGAYLASNCLLVR